MPRSFSPLAASRDRDGECRLLWRADSVGDVREEFYIKRAQSIVSHHCLGAGCGMLTQHSTSIILLQLSECLHQVMITRGSSTSASILLAFLHQWMRGHRCSVPAPRRLAILRSVGLCRHPAQLSIQSSNNPASCLRPRWYLDSLFQKSIPGA